MKKKKKIQLIVLISACILATLFCLSFLEKQNFIPVSQSTVTVKNKMDEALRTHWLQCHSLNDDYIGEIIFDSDLVHLSFVQAKDVYREDGTLYRFYDENGSLITDPSGFNGNDVYIWTNWETGEYDRNDTGGSVFVDYRNEMDDQNIIIYGHHFSKEFNPEGDKQFTPLDRLFEQENYETNKYLSLILDNTIRKYIITNICLVDVYEEEQIQILRTDPMSDLSGKKDANYKDHFFNMIDKISCYQTGNKLNEKDRILTLITCIEHQPQYREAVICKQVEEIIYES